jgi:hypothetical protein
MPKGIVGLPAQFGALKKKFFPAKIDAGKPIEIIQPTAQGKSLSKPE